MLFNFHNIVNERKSYQKFTYEKLDEKYQQSNLHGIINNFFINMSNSRNRELITHNMYSDVLLSNFKVWLRENLKYFNN